MKCPACQSENCTQVKAPGASGPMSAIIQLMEMSSSLLSATSEPKSGAMATALFRCGACGLFSFYDGSVLRSKTDPENNEEVVNENEVVS